jgi:small Trp-rich protein
MYLVWLATALSVAKWLEVGPVTNLSWWWILAMLGCAFVWFEGLERMFGRDRRQVEAADYEKRAQERVAENFAQSGPGRRKARR